MTCDGMKLTGVISFGYECGLSDFPGTAFICPSNKRCALNIVLFFILLQGVYTDVSKFNNWINETVAQRTLPPYEYALNSTTVRPTEEPTTVPTTTQNPNTASTGVAPAVILIACAVFGRLFI